MSMDRSVGKELDADVSEIRAALGRLRFPAQLDDVLAALLRRRAPSRLLWRVGVLPRTRRFRTLNDLCDDVAGGPGPGAPPPPGR